MPETLTWVDADGGEHPLTDAGGARVLKGMEGRFMPPVALVEEEVPFQPGAQLRHVKTLVREVAIPILFQAADASALRLALREWLSDLHVNRGPGVLRVDAPDGSSRELNAIYAGGMEIVEDDNTAGAAFQKAVLVFRAHDPYWYDENETSQTFEFEVASEETAGATSVGGSSASMASNTKIVNSIELSDPVTLSKLSIYVDGSGTGTGDQAAKAIIYSDDGGGSPDELVATGDAVLVTDGQAAGWVDLTFASELTLDAGTYWIGLITAANSGTIRYYYDAGTGYSASDTYADGPADPFGTPSALARTLSLYATYTPRVGPTAPFFPFFPLVLASSEFFGQSTIQNGGDVDAWPTWLINGPGVDPELRNITTGEIITLTATLGLGDYIEIDTRPGAKTVQDQDGNSLYSSLSAASSLWPLEPGSNAISVEMSAVTADSSIVLRYRRRFLSA